MNAAPSSQTGRRFVVAAAGLLLLAQGGCGSGQAAPPDAGGSDQPFAVCAGVDAGPYRPGLVGRSRSGAWTATVVSVVTTSSDAPPVDAPAVGLSTFTLTIADANGDPPAGLALSAEKPYMPLHGHSASIVPQVSDESGGHFTISQISFFMTGMFEIGLDMTFSAAGTTDRIVLTICVPS